MLWLRNKTIQNVCFFSCLFFSFYGWSSSSTVFSGECNLEAAEEGRHAMTMNVGWQELYQAALLELRPDELRRRIDEAEKAIQQRIVELSRNDSSSEEERRAMGDALRGLRVLASTECKAPLSTNPSLARNKATS